ncbi:MAG: endonuclease III [Candidatus Melainabacteria bacterium]|nr:endonuclease III [Candidatus Melainabacteria bacterium]
MDLKQRTKNIIQKLKDYYGEVKCFLRHRNLFELICAVCLSAQCTDERVNMTTPNLFKKFPDAASMAAAKQTEVEKVIKSCGFYKNKARNLIKMSQRIMSHHGGTVPNSIEELTQLAGVGRKTANVVLGTWFGKPAGVVVDTHVKRIVNLLGLSSNKEPEKIEQDLNQLVSKKYWHDFSLWLISHGRETCIARRAQCAKCILKKHCNYYQDKH